MKLITEANEIPANFTGMVEYWNNDKQWYKNSQLHREDGPAIEYSNGDKCWYLNGKCHREDGPACEYSNGIKYWYKNGKLHREDGPACEYSDGNKYWYLNGINYTESEFLNRTKPNPSCNGKIIEVDGKKYKLTSTE